MKRISILFTLSLFAVASAMAQSKPFTLTGKINNAATDVKYVYLNYRNDNGRVLDSSVITNGTYTFKGELSSPILAQLRVTYNDKRNLVAKDLYTLFLESNKMNIDHTDSFSNATVKGSAAHTAYDKLKTLLKATNERSAEASKAYTAARKANNAEEMKRLETVFDNITQDQVAIYKTYLDKNAGSPISLYVLQQYGGYDIDPAKVEPYYKKLPASLKNSTAGKQYNDRIQTAKKTAVGAMAMEFTQNDTLGKPVSLSSLRGKYLLVDFWASWCGPCRVENPNVVAAFNKYKDKGFHILGVSLDQPGAHDKWMKAIHDDGLTWTQVSDLKYWDNEVAKQYGIQAIPQNLLIDPNGKIVGRNLTGDKLKEKLEEIFAGK